MNQQRLQSYINLIQQLLTCPSGEEWILLRQNEALVTPELVQVMEQVANQLVQQGNAQEAKFLHNLAGQIHHLFVAQTVPRSENNHQSQAYLELIKALLECPKGSENELLTANQELIGPGLVHTMQQVAAEMATDGNQEAAHYLQNWARELNHLWLQQHNFQSILKPNPEPQHLSRAPVAAQFSPAPVPAPQFSSTAAQSSPPTLVEDDEDIWTELTGEPSHVQSQPFPPPIQPSSATTSSTPVPDSPPASSPLTAAPYEQINRHLETIAEALTKLSEILTPPAQPPTNPLWYMEVLERAQSENWVLTSAEIQQLIGVQPTCPRESDSFQRGCWIFVKAGKLGNQMGWRVKKE